jgi:acetolactate synthase-1/3 small subunit
MRRMARVMRPSRFQSPFMLPFLCRPWLILGLPVCWYPAPGRFHKNIMRHTISVLVENKFGVLARVAGMISGRGFNIDSLNVAPTHDASLSRITIVLKGDDAALDLCTKQLRKLVNVVEVMDFKEGQTIARELVLVKVRADAKTRPEILQIKEIFRARIANLAQESLIIELTGDEDKVAAFLGLLEPFGILEIARTGRLALTR